MFVNTNKLELGGRVFFGRSKHVFCFQKTSALYCFQHVLMKHGSKLCRCCYQEALPYFLKGTSNSSKYRKNFENKCSKRVPLLLKPLAYINHANTLNRELSQIHAFQEFCLVFKNTKFSKQFLMVLFAINHLRITFMINQLPLFSPLIFRGINALINFKTSGGYKYCGLLSVSLNPIFFFCEAETQVPFQKLHENFT